jgi:hypothetical protein
MAAIEETLRISISAKWIMKATLLQKYLQPLPVMETLITETRCHPL